MGVLTSAEDGNTVTVEICCSANGWAKVVDTGWMTVEVFLKWFRTYIEFWGQKKTLVLLLSDGHSSHTRKPWSNQDLARQNGVILLCFPLHCSYRFLPADLCVYVTKTKCEGRSRRYIFTFKDQFLILFETWFSCFQCKKWINNSPVCTGLWKLQSPLRPGFSYTV